MIKSLSIILPLYNEEKRIKKTFSDIFEFKKKSKIKFLEFVLVDDGSTDNSHQLIKNFIKKYKKNNLININLVLLKKIGSPIFNKEYKKQNLASFFRSHLSN